jgi:hypothetical protein
VANKGLTNINTHLFALSPCFTVDLLQSKDLLKIGAHAVWATFAVSFQAKGRLAGRLSGRQKQHPAGGVPIALSDAI